MKNRNILTLKRENELPGVNNYCVVPIPGDEPTVQNYLNPFNSVTNIRYTIPVDAHVNLSVYNQLGQKVTILANVKQLAGTHIVPFNASNRAAGMYLYQLHTVDESGKKVVISGKMLLTK